MPYQSSPVGIIKCLGIRKFIYLSYVVEHKTRQKKVAVYPAVVRGNEFSQHTERKRMFKQPAEIRVVHCLCRRREREKFPYLFIRKYAFKKPPYMGVFNAGYHAVKFRHHRARAPRG